MKRIQTSNKGNRKIVKRKTFYVSLCIFHFLFLTLFSGCGNKFFDPTQIGRFRPTPAVNVILNSLGVAEEEPVAWEGAEEPRPSDTTVIESDYTFRSGDTIMVSIYELFQEGVVYANNYIVTETGKISIPEVGVVQAAGLTETQLEEEIKQILSPNILKEPSVTATLVGSQQRTFSILGDGVAAPSRYVIPRYDFRLTDALATAGGTSQFNVSYIYVSRYAKDKTSMMAEPLELEIIEPESPEIEMIQPEFIEPEELDELLEPEQEMSEVITPMVKYQWPDSKVVIASTELATAKEYANAGWPKGFELSPGRKQTWEDMGTPKPSSQLVGPEKTQESVSIKDILKTLSERNHRERIDEKADVEDVLKSLPEPSAPKGTEEPIDVEDVLRSFAEPTSGVTEEPIGIEETPRFFAEPEEKPVDEFESITGPAVTETMKGRIEEETGRIEWIFQDGKWIPVQIGPPIEPEPSMPVIEFEREAPAAPPSEMAMPPYEWAEAEKTRVIKIPVDRLLAGDPRYNIVIKPGDSIFVPVDIIGEFCIMGNVNFQGYIPITGRPLTLKMAIAAAGGLNALAWPKRCEVVRRIGRDKEEIVMVDLDKIASGEQPDFFIKPNDLINVGTHATSIWRAVLRNAFRATYGFGFIYDRNFAYADYYGTTYQGIRPWDWKNIW